MQNCFRKYPEVYGSELDSDADDEDDMTVDAAPAHSEATPTAAYADTTPTPSSKPAASSKPAPAPASSSSSSPKSQSPTEAAPADKAKHFPERTSQPPPSKGLDLVPNNYKPNTQEQTIESERLVPKAAHDAGDKGTERLERK